MNICINSRDLSEHQRERIEQYFRDHFAFNGKAPNLIWKEDESDYIFLGFPQNCASDCKLKLLERAVHDSPVVMFRVHEDELLRIAGRSVENRANRCGVSCTPGVTGE